MIKSPTAIHVPKNWEAFNVHQEKPDKITKRGIQLSLHKVKAVIFSKYCRWLTIVHEWRSCSNVNPTASRKQPKVMLQINSVFKYIHLVPLKQYYVWSWEISPKNHKHQQPSQALQPFFCTQNINKSSRQLLSPSPPHVLQCPRNVPRGRSVALHVV